MHVCPHSHDVQVLVLHEDAERVKEELKHQQVAAARLEALGAHVSKDAELAPKARECLALLTPLPALADAMERRTAKLLEELERQRRLAKVRRHPCHSLCTACTPCTACIPCTPCTPCTPCSAPLVPLAPLALHRCLYPLPRPRLPLTPPRPPSPPR